MIGYSLCMFRATVVVFLILFAAPLSASELSNAIASLEDQWSVAYYQSGESQQRQRYPQLLNQASELVERYPQSAEAKIWLATIMASNAALESSFKALSTLDDAKSLLEAAIQLNPNALNGAAYLTLGTLYYMVPGWPVSFGDNNQAEQMLKASLKLNPGGIDANYFYGDYLMRQERMAEAEVYLRKAVQATVRRQQLINDSHLQKDAKAALANIQQKKLAAGDHSPPVVASVEQTAQ